jgi:SAM-dependent methyltransferase
VAELWHRADDRVEQFDTAALAYDLYRPRYPDAVFDAILSETSTTQEAIAAIEVGAGSGIATLPLVERGVQVTAIEPSPAMAAIATARVGPRAKVFVGRFEDWPASDLVDLIAAFNSWHWVDPSTAVPKAAVMLRPGGILALIWTDVLQYGQAPFERRLGELGVQVGSAFQQVTACLEHVNSDCGLLAPVITRCRFERQLDAETFVAVRNTYGGERSDETDRLIRSLINDEFEGTITKTEEAVAYLYRRC